MSSACRSKNLNAVEEAPAGAGDESGGPDMAALYLNDLDDDRVDEVGPSMYDQHHEMHDLWSGAEDDSEYESHGAMDEDHSADQMSSIVRMGI